jgi:hypothetical protein
MSYFNRFSRYHDYSSANLFDDDIRYGLGLNSYRDRAYNYGYASYKPMSIYPSSYSFGYLRGSGPEPFRRDVSIMRSLDINPYGNSGPGSWTSARNQFIAQPPSLGVNPIFTYNSAYMSALRRINQSPLFGSGTYGNRIQDSPTQIVMTPEPFNKRDVESPFERYDQNTGNFPRNTEEKPEIINNNNNNSNRSDQPDAYNYFNGNQNNVKPDELRRIDDRNQPITNKNDSYKYDNNQIKDTNQKNQPANQKKLPEVPQKQVRQQRR